MRSLALIAALLSAAAGGAAAQAPAGGLDATIEAIAKMRTASSPSFSPDGRRIAFISTVSGSPQVWVMPATGGEPVQVTKLNDPVQSVYWSPADDRLAYDVAPGGGLNVQIYVSRPDGSEAKLLTKGGEDNNRLDGWTDDGKRLRIASSAENPADFDAYLLDPATGAMTAVAKGKGLNDITDVSDDGRYAIVTRLVSRGNDNLYLVDLKSGTETLLTPHDGPGSFGWGEFSPDGRRIYVTSNGGRDLAAFGVIELSAAGKPGPIRIVAERADAEAEDGVLDGQGRRAALLWNVAGRSELAWLDTAALKASPGPVLPADVAGGMTFSRDGRRLALMASGAAAPVDIHVAEVPGGRFVQLTHSPHEGVDLATFVRPTLVKYRAADGVQLSGWLYRPRDAKGPGPVVFNYHGGPEGQARPTMSDLTQALVARGITVFAPNVRGSSGFGKRFVNLDNGALRVNGVKDIQATTDHLVSIGVADPKRLGIMGGSYGGYMVMAGVTEFPDMFAAGADLYGVVNFETFFKHTQPWMAAISTIEYGDPATQGEMLASLSPIHKLDRIKTPLIVLHGANDTNVPVVEAEQIVASLKARGVPVEYVLFPDEGHGWRKTPNRVRSTVSIVGFFDARLNRPDA